MRHSRTFDHYKTPLGADCTPYGYYEMIRDEAVAQNRFIEWSEAYGGFWVVVGWQESVAILENQADFSSSASTFPQYATPSGKQFMLAGYDEPEHSKYRRIVQAPFTRPRTLRMLEQMRSLSSMLLDDVAGDTHFDVCKVTDRLPGYAFCSMMGLSMQNEHLYRRFAYAMVEGANDPEAAAPTMREMGEYWLKLIAERRRNPGDGLIDAMIGADCDGRPLADEELLEFCTVLVAGRVRQHACVYWRTPCTAWPGTRICGAILPAIPRSSLPRSMSSCASMRQPAFSGSSETPCGLAMSQ